MAIRELPDFLVNQIAAGEVVERPASVVKELVENALDAGADQILVDVADGGRTMISVIDNGCGMDRDDLVKSITRHATSKLPGDDLLDINFMGFRGEALPSIASVSDMTIDTRKESGWCLNCTTREVKPSPWESGTRIRVANLFANTPARLKFLRGDRAEMMSVVEVIKRLAMARPDVGFTLNNRWRFPRGQTLSERIISVMGDDVRDRMLEINEIANSTGELSLRGFISEPTLRRASGIDQYLFVNGRPVKDKVLVGALRAAYMDVMSSREFPIAALYLELDPRSVDVNVSPAKTEVHFLEPGRVRGFIIRTLRDALGRTMIDNVVDNISTGEVASQPNQTSFIMEWRDNVKSVHSEDRKIVFENESKIPCDPVNHAHTSILDARPLGRVIGQIGNKYIIAENESGLVIIDQHAAHERITYERLRNHEIKVQPLLSPIVINLKPEEVNAVLEVSDEMRKCGLSLDQFGDDAIAIFEKPADWDMDWEKLLHDVADEVMANGHSSALHEKLHLKLANYACHHSVRAGQKLDFSQMDALLRDIEKTERASQCNHGRPVYKMIKIDALDALFERV